MAIDNSGLVYLFDSIFQIENLAGRPVCPGHIEVFVAGTDTKYITYQNFDGTRNPFKVPLNSDGRAVILVEAQFKYDVYIYDSFNNMICSRLNVAPAVGGDVSVSGLTEVYHDESLSGDGTPYAPLAVVSAGKVYSGIEPIVVNNDEDKISANTASFGVESPLYFVKDEASATVIGVDQSAMENFLTGKADSTAMNAIRYNMMSATAIGGVNNIITGYNGSAFSAGSTYSGIAPITVDNENNTISVSSKELEAQAPLQITDVGSAYQLSITANINSPRTRVIEYGTDRWSDVKSAMDDMSAGNIDYVVMKYTDASGNEYYAPLDKYAPGAACNFVCPSNEQDTVYGYGQRRKDTIFTINSGDQWVTRNVRPFIGRVIGGTNVTVDVQGEDYVISANGIDASASEAIDLVTANSGDWNGVSSKLDTTAFSTVSGDFITAHQSLPDSANWNSTYNTVYAKSGSWSSRPQEPVSGINIDIFESAGTVVFSGMTGGGKTYTGVSPVIVDNTADTISVSAKSISVETPLTFTETNTAFVFGISGTDKWDSTYDTVHDNSASWTGGGGGSYTGDVQGALDEVYTNSGTWGTVTNKLDTTAQVVTATGTATVYTGGFWPLASVISSINGMAILPYGYSALSANSASWTNTRATVSANSANWDSTYNTVSTNSGSWGGGSTYTGDAQGALDEVYTNSGTWNTVTDKLDTTAFSTVSGNFITALPASANWNATYTEVSTNSANWNSAAAMNELPVSAGQGIDIQNVDGNIVFSCTGGSDVPEGVMVESGLEYNAVNEISGYNGSAIAQYGAEKQWLVHDDTLVHAANSAQYALGVNLSAVAQLLGVDETVLWSGAADTKTSGTLTDSIWNYERVKMYINSFQGGDYITEISPTGTSPGTATRSFITYGPRGNNDCAFDMCKWIFSDTGFSAVSAKTFHSTWTATAITVENNQPAALGYCHKIVGIGRKS